MATIDRIRLIEPSNIQRFGYPTSQTMITHQWFHLHIRLHWHQWRHWCQWHHLNLMPMSLPRQFIKVPLTPLAFICDCEWSNWKTVTHRHKMAPIWSHVDSKWQHWSPMATGYTVHHWHKVHHHGRQWIAISIIFCLNFSVLVKYVIRVWNLLGFYS